MTTKMIALKDREEDITELNKAQRALIKAKLHDVGKVEMPLGDKNNTVVFVKPDNVNSMYRDRKIKAFDKSGRMFSRG